MARIFFFTNTGEIYGVHPGPHEADSKITLPEGVTWVDVPGAPDQIAWPSPDGTLLGVERFCRVNPVTKVLEVRADWREFAVDLLRKADLGAIEVAINTFIASPSLAKAAVIFGALKKVLA